MDDETGYLLNYADTCYQQSDGLFHITSGVLRYTWRFHTNTLPSQDEIDPLLEKVGWHKLNWHKPSLEYTQPGMELDFGGIVKEYAVDRAATLCREAEITHALINLGATYAWWGRAAMVIPGLSVLAIHISRLHYC